MLHLNLIWILKNILVKQIFELMKDDVIDDVAHLSVEIQVVRAFFALLGVELGRVLLRVVTESRFNFFSGFAVSPGLSLLCNCFEVYDIGTARSSAC